MKQVPEGDLKLPAASDVRGVEWTVSSWMSVAPATFQDVFDRCYPPVLG